jgi:MFS family permease
MSFTSARRDVRLIATAKAVSWLGDEVALLAVVLHAQGAGRGAGTVAALLIANTLPLVLLSGVVGRLVDRYDNRRLLAGSGLAQAALCTALAFTASSPAAVLVLLALIGAGQSVNAATWSALLPAVAAREDLPRAVGTVQAATTLAGVLAPALGGVLYGAFGTRVPLLLDAATFVLVVAAGLAIRTRRVVTDARAERGGVSIVRRDALLRPLFALLALFVLLGSMVNVVDVFLVRVTLQASATWYGIAGACFSAGALAGAVLTGRLAGGTRRLARGFVGACGVLAVGLIAMGCAPSVWWLLPAGLVTGSANGALNVTLGALVMGHTAATERGRVGALLSGVASGTQLVAFAVGGALTSLLEPRAVFVLAGACGLAAPVLLGRRVVRAAAGADSAQSGPMETVLDNPAAA